MSDLVKRALQVLGNATVNQGKEYTSNVTSFINDAKDVHNMIIRQTTDVADTYTRLKNTNFTKKISDWFYQKEAESDLDAAEEFDSGMKPSADVSESDKDGDTVSRPLTTESMTDIFEKSTAAAYKIGRKQTEQSVINTSEIVSTFNSRSSEIITSINNVNRTLIDIRTTLDNLAKAYGAVNTASGSGGRNNTEDMSSLYSGGQLSLARIFEASKSSLARNSYVEGAQTMMRYIMEGGPEGLAQFGISALLNRIKVPGSDKSIDELAKGINESIGNAIQTGLSEAIGSKWFKAVFGDIAKTETGFDYGSLVKNSYDNKRATFDGMTRMSIVTLIPEMLAKINETLSGKSYHVDNTGHWAAGPVTDDFMKVTGNAFASSGINIKARTAISNAGMRSVGKQIPDEDIELAGEALTGMLVNYIVNEEGTTNFTISMLKSMDSSEIISDATMMCVNASKHGDVRYWAKVCQTILLTLTSDMTQSHKFVTNVNTSARSMMDAAKDFAQSGRSNAHQARTITKSLMQAQFLNSKSGSNSVYTGSNPDVNLFANKAGAGGSVVDGRVNNDSSKPKHTLHQYVEGIYGILNRGINVKVSKKKGAFPDYAFGQGATKTNEDDTLARVFLSGAAGGKSDEQNLKNIVKMSIQETTDSLLGNNSDNQPGLLGALLGSNGFLGNVVGSFGAQALRSAANGTLADDFSTRRDNVVNTAKGGVDRITAAVSNLLDAVSPGILRNNRKFMGLKAATFGEGGFIDEATGKIVDTAKSLPGRVSGFIDDRTTAFMNNTVDKNGKLGKFINKSAYNLDTKALNSANKLLDDYIPENEIDQFYLSTCRRLIEEGRYSTAAEMSENISDPSVKAVVNKAISICQKRFEGEYAIANGEAPVDIGSVSDSQLQTFINTKNAGKTPSLGKSILSTIGNGIRNIGSLIGKLYSFLWKTFKSGAQDVFYGGRSWIRGWTTILKTLIGKPIAATTKFIFGVITKARDFVTKTVWPWMYKGLHSIHMTIKSTLSKMLDSTKTFIGDIAGSISSKAGEWFNKRFSGSGKTDGVFGAFKEGLFEPWREKKKSLAQDKAENPLMDRIREAVDKIKEKIPEIPEEVKTKAKDKTSSVDPVDAAAKSLTKDRENNPLLSKMFDLLTDWKKDYNKDNEKGSSGSGFDVYKAKDGFTGVMQGLEGVVPSKDLGEGAIAGDATKASMSAVSSWTAGGVSSSTSTEAVGELAAGAAAGGKLGLVATLAKSIGQVLGGSFKLVLGPLKMIASAVMGFTVVKELIKDVKEVIGASIKNLSPLVTEIAKTIRKFIPAIKAVVDTVVDMIKSIATPIVATLEPMMKQLVPQIVSLVKTVSGILTPILVGIAEKILPKIVYGITFMLKAVNKVIGVIEIVSGTLRFVFGMGLAKLGSFVTEFGKKWGQATFWNHNDDDTNAIVESGQKMGDVGTDIAQKGVDTYREGIRSWTGDYDNQYENTDTKDFSGNVDTTKVQLANEFGSGDVTNNNTTINNSYSYTYGSGNVTNNQQSYGNYMNMAQRGCGPVALAEVFNRRTGGDLNARTLASSMLNSGAYAPSKGTSIASMISTGRALGINLRAGDVTQESLKNASPSNPITVYGSGTGFGTRRGNGHYVNVVGSDGQGNVLVSNPLSGKVARQNISAIVGNAKLGLYGSGDYDAYGFDEGTQTAFSKLKELTDRLTGMFQLKDSADSAVEQAELDSKYNDITMGMSETDWAEMRANSEFADAVTNYSKFVKRKDDESDDEYNRRVEKEYLETTSGKKLVVKLGASKRKSSLDVFGDWMQSKVDNAKFDLENSKIASDGGIEMAAFSPIIHTETNITNATDNASPVHDFFTATNDAESEAWTIDGGWYLRGNRPKPTGEGQSGSDSDGVLFYLKGLKEGVAAKIKAITGGTVTYVGRNGDSSQNANGGLGNHVKWKDLGGMYHWYYHLGRIDPSISEGSQITGGQVIGYVGEDVDPSTGLVDAGGAKFGYTLSRVGPYGSTGDGTENPLGYWKFYESGLNVTGDNDKEMLWNTLRAKGLTAEQAAAIMGNVHIESAGVNSRIVQGDVPISSYSTAYTDKVDSGLISRDDFMYNGPNGGGYGFGQWTSPDRKGYLYEATRGRGKSIGDAQTQANFLLDEPGQETTVTNFKAQSSLADATVYWMKKWENPSDQGVKAQNERIKWAQYYYDLYKNNPVQSVIVADENGRHAVPMGGFRSTYANKGSGGSGSYITTDDGVALWTDEYADNIEVTGTDISKSSVNSPLFEFFAKTMGLNLGDVVSSSWYKKRHSPNKDGVGGSGGEHHGIDFAASGAATKLLGMPLYSTTGGTVRYVRTGYNDGCGNSVKWEDPAGYYHWYMHMRDPGPLVKKDQVIEPGTLIGYVGHTGSTIPVGEGGTHLHYSIHKGEPMSEGVCDTNPLTYFNNYNPNPSDSSGNTGELGTIKGGLTHNITSSGKSIISNDTSIKASGTLGWWADPAAKAMASNTGYDGFDNWWDISTWSSLSNTRRNQLFDYLADKDAIAQNKGNYSQVYPPTYAKDFAEMYNSWTNYGPTEHPDFPHKEIQEQLDSLYRQTGAGDVSSVSKGNIPPIDFSKLTDNMNDTVTPYVNLFNIKPDSSSKDDLLKRMSQMTFNVRAQRVEELLEDLIGIVSEGKNKVPSPNTSSNNQADPFLFNNEIPPQVTRLARG